MNLYLLIQNLPFIYFLLIPNQLMHFTGFNYCDIILYLFALPTEYTIFLVTTYNIDVHFGSSIRVSVYGRKS